MSTPRNPHRSPRLPRTRRAFTLIDMLMTLAVLGVALLVAVSASGPSGRIRLLAASQQLASDIESAREYSVSRPSDLTGVRFATAGDGYWLARESATETPITKSDGTPYATTFGQGRSALLLGVTVTLRAGGVKPPDGGLIVFDAFGRLHTPTNAAIDLVSDGATMTVVVSAATGDTSIQ